MAANHGIEQEPLAGLDEQYVKLISNDKHTFILPKNYVECSSTIEGMLMNPPDKDTENGVENAESRLEEVNLFDINAYVLDKLCHYFAYQAHYNDKGVAIPEFEVTSEEAEALLLAANFLRC